MISHTRMIISLQLLMLFLSLGSTAYAQEQNPADDGRVHISPTGYLQFDIHSFPEWGHLSASDVNRDEIEVRRMRAGLEGDWRRLAFELSVDPQDDDGIFVKDAYGEFRFTRFLRIRAGQFKLPGTREYSISARNTDFMERTALASSLATGRDRGLMLRGRISRRLEYDAGLFAGDGVGRIDRAGMTTAGRLHWEPMQDVDIGTSFSEGWASASREYDPENGIDVRTSSGYRFFEGLYVNGRRLRLTSDVRWSPGRWEFIAEGLRVRDERREQGIDYDDLPSIVARSLSLSTLWHLGRDRSLGVRYEITGLNDTGPETGRDSVRPRASDVRARSAETLTLGASWKPYPWMRLMSNAGLERYSEPRSAPEAGRGSNYFTAGVRVQFELP